MEFFDAGGHIDKGRVCGPDIVLRLIYHTNILKMDVTITPYETGGMDVNFDGNAPWEPMLPEGLFPAAYVDTLRNRFQGIAEMCVNVCDPQMSSGYLLMPGYMPDSNMNYHYLIYPCGKPRGEHWHPMAFNPAINTVTEEELLTTLGEHNQRDLGLILYDRCKHIWPKEAR